MSVPDVATSITIRNLVPSVAAAQPSALVVRWVLRAVTVILFTGATIIGVNVALAAPTEAPGSIGEPRR